MRLIINKNIKYVFSSFVCFTFLLIIVCSSGEKQVIEHNLTNENSSQSFNKDEKNILSVEDISKKRIELETILAERKTVCTSISATGKIIPNANSVVVISPLVTGRIARIFVNEGDYVQKGQKLADIESVELGKAKSDFNVAGTEYKLARLNYERIKSLFDQNVGSQKDLLMAEADMKKSESNFLAVEKQLHLMGISEEEVHSMPEGNHTINAVISLLSPISGTVVERNIILGEKVDPDKNLFKVIDLSNLWLDVNIYENDIPHIKKMQRVEVIMKSYPNITFQGKIMYIGSEFNDQTRTIPVRTEVINQDNKLKIGMFAQALIYLNEGKNCLVIPESAVLDDESRSVVFVKQNANYEKRFVRLGDAFANCIEVRDGLREGEIVVTKGNFQLLSETLSKSKFGVHTH